MDNLSLETMDIFPLWEITSKKNGEYMHVGDVLYVGKFWHGGHLGRFGLIWHGHLNFKSDS